MKAILLPICLFSSVAVCPGQSNKTVNPDLTGTWEAQYPHNKGETKSEYSPPEQIKITYHDPELIIHRKVGIEDAPAELDLTYYTDGRGEKNTEWPATERFEAWKPAEVQSQTSWSNDKIVTRSVRQSFSGAAIFVVEIVDEWKLSSDGKTLTQTTRTTPKKDVQGNAAYGDGIEIKIVYKLISK